LRGYKEVVEGYVSLVYKYFALNDYSDTAGSSIRWVWPIQPCLFIF